MLGGNQEIEFLFYLMFWTILAMMLVLLYSLKEVKHTQSVMRSIDINLEKLVIEVLKDEQEIIKDIEDIEPRVKRVKKLKVNSKKKK